MTVRTSAARVAVGTLAATLLVQLPSATSYAEDEGSIAQLVVKVSGEENCTVDALAQEWDFTVDDWMLASRGLYRAHANQEEYQGDPGDVKKLTDKLRSDYCVAYAEPDHRIRLEGAQFHSWTPGEPEPATQDDWLTQPARSLLGLGAAHTLSTGLGVTVAVLDTGVDPLQGVLAGSLLPGTDYVDDDTIPDDVATGTDSDGDGLADEATGHGTFVTGMVAMVAPDAQILPLRVLDSDGNGTVFTIAEAVYDAVAAGAKVINMSFGTSDRVESKVLDQALDAAKKSGVLVVAAAGNNGARDEQYPASGVDVWAVAATNTDNSNLATYSNQGGWVDVAARGDDLVGPLPGDLFGRWSGTSLAAPLVSGQIALLWSLAPGQPAKKVSEALGRTCRKVAHAEMKKGLVDVAASLSYALRH